MSTIEELVGNTPLAEIKNLNTKPSVKLFGKLEGNNPGGSVKDRPALWMFNKAEFRGELQKGMKLIEPTSGNTGIALAMIAAIKGYEIELSMPENSTVERVKAMRAFGAKITLTPSENSMEGAIEYARGLVKKKTHYMLNQFDNPDNPWAHYHTTGPEIWRDTEGKITHFVSSMGTTGTITGVSKFLKEKNPNIKIIGVQPAEGSMIPGIRCWPKEYLPKIYDPSRIDEIWQVNEDDAKDVTRKLASAEGIFSGTSSGGAMCVALRLAHAINEGVIVSIVCDRGDRYLSSNLFE